MLKIRRPRSLFFLLEDRELVDIHKLLGGQLKLARRPQMQALSLLEAARFSLTLEDLNVLLEIPSDRWVPAAEFTEQNRIEPERLEWLTEHGLLLCDREQPPFDTFRRMDEKLEALAWQPYGALFHFMNRWQDERVQNRPPGLPEGEAASSEEMFADLVARLGPPPAAFHHRPDATGSLELPRVERESELYRLLVRRRTRRSFDRERLMRLDDLSTLLYYTFGCQGVTPLSEDVLALRKSSPSGGSLHPIEVYPLISRVDGAPPGLYHYNVEKHSLDLLREIAVDELGELAEAITAGQTYARSAHVLLLMTARFFRNFWKYRGQGKTYSVVLMDAGHLSQTLYLVATELGLGVFFSGAINGANIEQLLGLDPLEEGSIAVCGCGEVSGGGSHLDLVRQPFTPGGAAS